MRRIYFRLIIFRILVKMDDKILRHYSNESTFVITTLTNSENPDSVAYDVILAEIEVD